MNWCWQGWQLAVWIATAASSSSARALTQNRSRWDVDKWSVTASAVVDSSQYLRREPKGKIPGCSNLFLFVQFRLQGADRSITPFPYALSRNSEFVRRRRAVHWHAFAEPRYLLNGAPHTVGEFFPR